MASSKKTFFSSLTNFFKCRKTHRKRSTKSRKNKGTRKMRQMRKKGSKMRGG